jgi:hypothetical protein
MAAACQPCACPFNVLQYLALNDGNVHSLPGVPGLPAGSRWKVSCPSARMAAIAQGAVTNGSRPHAATGTHSRKGSGPASRGH